LWQEDVGFEYGLAKSGFNRLSYVELMQWIAAKAAVTLAETGQMTVVVQDNGSIHKSRIAQAQWDAWAAQGLIMFFLPPYCSEMNPNKAEEVALRDPLAIMGAIALLDAESAEILAGIGGLL
jgi:putative transposase